MSRRNELSDYINQNLYVKGVLIGIDKPNKKNHHQAGLIFGSVELPNEDIQLDHVVIAVPEKYINANDLQLYNVYGFTAKVGTYRKMKRIHGVNVSVKAYHLMDLNWRRFEELEPEVPKDLTRYLKNRMSALRRRNVPIDLDKVNEILATLKEGEREQYVQTITMTMSKNNVTHADIMNAIY